MDTTTSNYSTSAQVATPIVTPQNLPAIWGVMSTLVTDEGITSDSVISLHLTLSEAFSHLVTVTVAHILDHQEIALEHSDESCVEPSHFEDSFFCDSRDPYTYHDMEGDFDGSVNNVPHISKFTNSNANGFKDSRKQKTINLSKLKVYAESKGLAFKDLPDHFKSVDINEEHLAML